jgi:glutamate--cysteine ligase catalytic subunit
MTLHSAQMLKSSITWIALVLLFERLNSAILRLGNPLNWLKSKPYLQSVRASGYNQFLIHYLRSKDIQTPLFLWGDEIEYGIFKASEINGHYDLSLNATATRERLTKEEELLHNDLPIGCEWQPEYGSWMIEAVPRNPYGSYISDLLNVEKSLQLRRKRLHNALALGEIAPSTSNFPMLGVDGYNHTLLKGGNISDSLYVSDEVINPHPRFGTLTQNIRSRRKSNVNITIPRDLSMFQNTVENSLNKNKVAEEEEVVVGESSIIHMDAMAFGMGCCCLQVTMQAKNEAESRYLHDQLAVISPILQALSAATPIFKGFFVSSFYFLLLLIFYVIF